MNLFKQKYFDKKLKNIDYRLLSLENKIYEINHNLEFIIKKLNNLYNDDLTSPSNYKKNSNNLSVSSNDNISLLNNDDLSSSNDSMNVKIVTKAFNATEDATNGSISPNNAETEIKIPKFKIFKKKKILPEII